jgi:hypothetical protein
MLQNPQHNILRSWLDPPFGKAGAVIDFAQSRNGRIARLIGGPSFKTWVLSECRCVARPGERFAECRCRVDCEVQQQDDYGCRPPLFSHCKCNLKADCTCFSDIPNRSRYRLPRIRSRRRGRRPRRAERRNSHPDKRPDSGLRRAHKAHNAAHDRPDGRPCCGGRPSSHPPRHLG